MSSGGTRNFAIVAHIDHGKSTLADRLLEICGAVTERESTEQFLDSMDLERERGITIKASAVRLTYSAEDGKEYRLNLIDTPGHVDFHYEVSRALAACEGAVLVVDATQGVEAQTLANVYLALDNDLEILPVINKIDLASADVERVKNEIEDVIGLDASDAIAVSAKDGTNVRNVLEAITKRIPVPKGDPDAPLAALVFDSWYDSYQGVMIMLRVRQGRIRKGDSIRFMASGKDYEVTRVGVYMPQPVEVEELAVGDVGFVAAGVKEIGDAMVGDTVTSTAHPALKPLPGFRPAKPMVFSGIFPVDPAQYVQLREALEKLSLNDSSFVYEPETSQALGFGFRCGYLGLLHMEIVQERLEREYGLDLVNTSPTVVYKVMTVKGEEIDIENPSKLPPPNLLAEVEEPIVRATIHCPSEYVGAVVKLCVDRRGIQKDMSYPAANRTILVYEMPLAEIVVDFYDKLKSVTRGYASLDYDLVGYQAGDLIRLDILVNGEPVDALTVLVHKERAYYRGVEICRKLKEEIPRQMFDVAIQAAIGSKVIARTTVKSLRKDVTAKCYGGDISRKRKLLEKQKAGKKRMKSVGNVVIPQSAFLAVLKRGDN
ncbi:MAG: elongation factor 4 [Deltaproteobacteria bacterium]|nr:elongation factor 4 [Deltaproteobacteria bacterium]